jgi:hypothetical protein
MKTRLLQSRRSRSPPRALPVWGLRRDPADRVFHCGSSFQRIKPPREAFPLAHRVEAEGSKQVLPSFPAAASGSGACELAPPAVCRGDEGRGARLPKDVEVPTWHLLARATLRVCESRAVCAALGGPRADLSLTPLSPINGVVWQDCGENPRVLRPFARKLIERQRWRIVTDEALDLSYPHRPRTGIRARLCHACVHCRAASGVARRR